MTIQIAVIDVAKSFNNQQRAAVIQALNNQVHNHFAPNWNGLGSNFQLIDGSNWNTATFNNFKGYVMMLLSGQSPQGDAGEHSDSISGHPIIDIWVDACHSAGIPVSMAMSHEVLELIADEYISSVCYDWVNNVFWIQEVCDPVAFTAAEGQTMGYAMPNGTVVSNFVFPVYFNGLGIKPDELGQVDYLKSISGAIGTFGAGGYLGKYVPGTGWTMVGALEDVRVQGMLNALGKYKFIGMK